MSGTPAAAGLRISMLIRSIGRCLAAIALAYCAASAGTFTRKIMRSSPIVSRTPMMPNGYATGSPVTAIGSGAAFNVASIYWPASSDGVLVVAPASRPVTTQVGSGTDAPV